MASKKYCEYFDVNESYFPCIDESAINAGAPWETTYPHETFIDLLNSAEKMLGGTTNVPFGFTGLTEQVSLSVPMRSKRFWKSRTTNCAHIGIAMNR